MRQDDPSLQLIQTLVDRIFPRTPSSVERVQEGVSTFVYRIQRGGETFYLRVLPEEGDSFAPEVYAHTRLRELGVLVPEVVYFEHLNGALQRSVMLTTEIGGRPLSCRCDDRETRRILVEAGRELALINRLPVAGFGWVRRNRETVTCLEAEHPTYRAFAQDTLQQDLAALGGTVLSRSEIRAISATIDRHDAWLDAGQGRLAHGDLDVTHIYEQWGRYSGIIDFGEIRGSDAWYDLGHFWLHDGETLPARVLPWLLEGYREIAPLPADAGQRIVFAGLLIGLRALARRFKKDGPGLCLDPDLQAIRQAIRILEV